MKLRSFAAFFIFGFCLAMESAGALGQGKVYLSQEQFISPDFEATSDKGFSYLGAQVLHGLDVDQNSGLMADIRGQFGAGASVMSYMNISELAWKDDVFSVGRKKANWSRLDQMWHLGLFEPQFRWNPLQPESQGLSGVFLDLETPVWGLRLFGSFLFIPDQGPSYEIKSGEFAKANPWFQEPPRSVRFLGQTEKINYDLQTPQTNEVIFNRSFVGQFYLGDSNEGFYFQTSMANKPANQLALGFDGKINAESTAQIQILPKVYYHSLIASEISYSQGVFNSGITGLAEKPQNPDYEDKWTSIYYDPSTVISPFVEYKNLRGRVAVSYLKVYGGAAKVRGPLASSNQTSSAILPSRYPYDEAAQVQGQLRFPLKRRQYVDSGLRYVQGAGNLFSTIVSENKYGLNRDMSINFNFQLVSAQESPEAERTLPGQYVNNDSVSLGFAYVF